MKRNPLRRIRAVFLWQSCIQIVGLLFPWYLRRKLYMACFPGWRLSSTARLSRFSLVMCARFRMDDSAIVKPLVYIGSLKSCLLSSHSSVGILNYISGAYPSSTSSGFRQGCLRLGRGAGITSIHRIDCSGGFGIGAMSILAGYFTQVLTHSIDLHACKQVFAPVRIGKYCFVGTRATILPGATICDCSVLAACSLLLSGTRIETYSLAAGVPALIKKKISPENGFLLRIQGYVS